VTFTAGSAPARLRPGGAFPYPRPSGIGAYPEQVGIWTDPEKLPADRAAIPDDDLISIQVWAKLQGVGLSTAYSNNSKSARRREDGEARAGDMPAPDDHAGQTPMWLMRTYRAWAKSRPGSKGTSGTGTRGGRGRGKQVRLPFACPHCHHEITEEDLDAAQAEARAEFARLRADGAAVAEAGERVGLDEATARSWEMARRSSARRVEAEPVTVEMPNGRRRQIKA
jgi:hypothetical protein